MGEGCSWSLAVKAGKGHWLHFMCALMGICLINESANFVIMLHIWLNKENVLLHIWIRKDEVTGSFVYFLYHLAPPNLFWQIWFLFYHFVCVRAKSGRLSSDYSILVKYNMWHGDYGWVWGKEEMGEGIEQVFCLFFFQLSVKKMVFEVTFRSKP